MLKKPKQLQIQNVTSQIGGKNSTQYLAKLCNTAFFLEDLRKKLTIYYNITIKGIGGSLRNLTIFKMQVMLGDLYKFKLLQFNYNI